MSDLPVVTPLVPANGGGGSGSNGGTTTTGTQAGPPISQAPPTVRAVAIAVAQVGAPYKSGGVGPYDLGFDCSGLMQYAYFLAPDSPGIDPGRTTLDQWNNQKTFYTVPEYDVLRNQAGGTMIAGTDGLQIGDLLLYAQAGVGGDNAHVKMYIGGGQTVEAPYTGAFVMLNPVSLADLSANEPFQGVKRLKPDAVGAGGAGGSDKGASTPTGGPDQLTQEQISLLKQDLPDPRNNLPFSAYFTGTMVAGAGARGSVSRAAGLVRGGMSELMVNTSQTGDPTKDTFVKRDGGPFQCFFMMNPATIATDCSIQSNMAPVATMDPATQSLAAGLLIQSQVISFTLIFNRMYEVWQGGVGNPNPRASKAGPSDIGCRWDIRAVERLMGIYDAQADYPGTSGGKLRGNFGMGTYGAGAKPPQAMLLQVVFGGPNSIQFQGMIAQMNYTYTLFDVNMIPVEATVEISIQRKFLPQAAGGQPGSADIVSPLVNNSGQMGTVFTQSANTPFNIPTVVKGGVAQS